MRLKSARLMASEMARRKLADRNQFFLKLEWEPAPTG